ncbi:uncharacterized protein LOC113371369 [Ctenocephalides felis]|uniref:uncharacterized protein LOC113371369 n=1 Tax=Ctenocephalides felis TaxID=7515 RepID=UPI000E6E49F1|nr:uncharacterized protein LOC113371369 [Ctenocephalides felis]
MENGDKNIKEQGSVSISPNLERIGVKIPPFWAEKPELWFAQLEGQFLLGNVSADATKFYIAISQLDTQHAVEIEDIILNPPDTRKYEKLKEELFKRSSKSREQKLKQLLEHEELNDRKPTQFLRHLRSLQPVDTVPDSLLRTIWSDRLPSQIQAIIASRKDMSLEAVAELADDIINVIPPASRIETTAISATHGNITELTKSVEDLRKQVSKLLAQNKTKRRSRSNSPYINRQSKKYDVCWYHHRWQEKALKCVKPCSFQQSKNMKGSR